MDRPLALIVEDDEDTAGLGIMVVAYFIPMVRNVKDILPDHEGTVQAAAPG